MHHKLLILLIFSTLWPSSAATSVSAQSVEEVLAKHLTARGGRTALLEVQSVRIRGTLEVAGIPAAMTVLHRRPGAIRIDVERGQLVDIQAYDGVEGWEMMATQGQTEPQALAAGPLSLLRQQADFDGPLVDPPAKGHRVEFLGYGGPGAKLIELRLTRVDGSKMTSYLDPLTWLEVRQEFSMKLSGQEVEVVLTFEDYRPVRGVMFAHKFSQQFVGFTVGTKFLVEVVEIDPNLEEEIFRMPLRSKNKKGANP